MVNTLQRKLENTSWVTEIGSRVDFLIQLACDHNHCTSDEITARLERGEQVYFSTYWSDMIRYKPEPVAVVEPVMVLCACGHTCEKSQVMTTSRGSSCFDCYNRMSD